MSTQLHPLKKTGYILLLFILVFQPGGMLLFYKLQQGYRKIEMGFVMNEVDCKFQSMSLSLHDFKQFKVDDHEISIHGEMYDIKKQVKRGDKMDLVVIRDKDEENIVKRIFGIISTKSEPGRDFSNQIKQLLSLNYISPETAFVYFVPSLKSSAFPVIFVHSSSEFIPTSSPPPWIG